MRGRVLLAAAGDRAAAQGAAARTACQRAGLQPLSRWQPALQRELLAFCRQRKSYTPRDYFGYDPRRQAPVDDSPELCTRCGNDNLRGVGVLAASEAGP